MSKNGWGACSACHPNGLTDNVVWIFPAGPRRTIPQHADFDLGDPDRKNMRLLNWSANRDEQEDFENNIRAVSGGQGLIVLADGVTQDTNVNDFTPLGNGGRNQLKVRGTNAWDGLKAYIQFGIRAPISPAWKSNPDVIAGEALFKAANCQQCHGGAQWTTGEVRFNPPPDTSQAVAGQIAAELRNVGTFDPAAFNEIRQNAAARLARQVSCRLLCSRFTPSRKPSGIWRGRVFSTRSSTTLPTARSVPPVYTLCRILRIARN